MKHSRVYGSALILGAVGTVITMIFHPTGGDLLQEDKHAAKFSEFLAIATHSLALISYPVLCFGFIGLYRKLAKNEVISTAALVALFFGAFSILIAATASGLIAPTLTRQILEADEVSRTTLHAFLDYNFAINQAFTKVFVVASSTSIVLWSVNLWKEGIYARVVSGVGCLIALISLLAFFGGHLQLDVHGFGLLAFAQAFWMILVGIFLFRAK